MSTTVPTPAPAPAPSPIILLFARAVIATLDLWPALTIAVREQWGGRDSADKKTWIASVLIDEFESRSSSPLPTDDVPLDEDEIADLLQQIMSDEFDANIEDGSVEGVAADLVRVWKVLVAQAAAQQGQAQAEGGAGDASERAVRELEERAAKLGKSVQATAGPGPEVDDGDSDDDDDDDGSGSEDGMDVDDDGEAAPQLVPATATAERERQEPVVDEDGFELVQKKGRR